MAKKSPKTSSAIVQEHPDDAPSGWKETQEVLAASSGLSLLLVKGHQPPAIAVSNNNSICEAFQSSPEQREPQSNTSATLVCSVLRSR
jgi:hypothetical protein